MIVQKCTAKFAFEARSEKELSFEAGDEIVVETKMNSGWWIGELKGKVGLFPVNYTEVGPEEQVEKYPPIKLRTQPSTSIAELQKQCGLISEKKELTKLQRQKISSKITDLQNKMQATINRSLAAQQSTGLGHSAAAPPPRSSTDDSSASDKTERDAGEDSLVTVLKAKPSGPRGRRAMSRGHLSTLRVAKSSDQSTAVEPQGEAESPGSREASSTAITAASGPSLPPTTTSEGDIKRPDGTVTSDEGADAQQRSSVQNQREDVSDRTADTSVSENEQTRSLKKDKTKKQSEDDDDLDPTRKKKLAKAAGEEVHEEKRSSSSKEKKKKSKKKEAGDKEKKSKHPDSATSKADEKDKRKSKRRSRIVTDDVVSAEEARRAVRLQQQESSKSKHTRSPSTSALSGLAEQKEKSHSTGSEDKKLRRTVSIQGVADQAQSEDASDKKKSKKKEIRELTRKLRAETKLRTALEESSAELQKELLELRKANAQLIDKAKVPADKDGSPSEEQLSAENAALKAEVRSMESDIKKANRTVREEGERARLAEGEVESLREDIAKLKASHDEDFKSIREKLETSVKNEADKRKKISELRKQVGELSTARADADDTIATKTKKIDELSLALSQASAKTKEVSLDCSKLRDTIQRMTSEQTVAAKSMELVTRKLSAVEEENKSLVAEKESLQKEVGEAVEKAEKSDQSCKVQAAAAAAAAASLVASEAARQELSVELKKREEAMKLRMDEKDRSASEEVSRLSLQCEQLVQEKTQLETEMRSKQEESSIMAVELDQLRSSNTKLSEKLVRVESQLTASEKSYEEKLKEIEESLSQESSARNTAERQLTALKQELAGERSALENEAEMHAEELRAQLQKSRTQVEDLSTKLASERDRLSQVESQRGEELDQMQAAHAAELTALREQHEAILHASKASLAEELSKKQEELSDSVSFAATLKDKLASVIDSLESAKAELIRSQNDKIQLSEELNSIKGRFDQLSLERSSAVEEAAEAREVAEQRLSELALAKSELDAMRDNCRRLGEEHGEQLLARERELTDRLSQASTGEVQELRSELLDVKEALGTATRELSRCKEEVSQLQAKLVRERQAHAASLEEERAEMTAHFDEDLSAVRKELESLATQRKNDLQAAEEEIGRLKCELTNANSETEKVRGELSDIRHQEHSERNEEEKEDSSIMRNLEVENNSLKQEVSKLEASLRQLEGEMKKQEKTAAANRRRFDEIADLKSDVGNLEEELASKEAKIARLKSEHSFAIASLEAQLEEAVSRNAQMALRQSESSHGQIGDLEKKLAEANQQLDSEKKIRDQLQSRLRSAETELSNVRAVQKAAETEAAQMQAARLEELSSTPASSKAVKRLVEQKHLLEDKVLALTKKLSEQADAQQELEMAFSDRLNSLISTIDEENEKRSRVEAKHKKTLARLDETETKLVQETLEKKQLEGRVGELSEQVVALEHEVLNEAELQNSLKEAFAGKLDEFCQTLDKMYDKQMEIQAGKEEAEKVIESLESKLLEETRSRLDAQTELRTEISIRQELESSFIEKLEKLSLLVMQEANASSYDELVNDG